LFGFVANPIIDAYLWYNGGTRFLEDPTAEPETWIEHFLKGFFGLGLVSFLKVFFASPFRWFRIGGGGGRRPVANTGRDRVNEVNWLIVVIGVLTFLYVRKYIRPA